jgi:hypothetical protein
MVEVATGGTTLFQIAGDGTMDSIRPGAINSTGSFRYTSNQWPGGAGTNVKINTSIASGSASHLILDLQDGAVSKWKVDTNGLVTSAGGLTMSTAGAGLSIKEGTNACMGVTTLSSGSVVVSTNKVTANSRIMLTTQSLGTVSVPQAIAVTARSAGTSFTITSADGTDTSVIAWEIIEPA